MEEEVTLKLSKQLIQVNISAIDLAVKAVGLNGAEASRTCKDNI